MCPNGFRAATTRPRRHAPGARPAGTCPCTTPRPVRPPRASPRPELAAGVAALGPEVDDPVGLLDHVEVVLDHEHRVARRRRAAGAPRAASRCPRSAGRSSARRGCTASARSRPCDSSVASLTRCASPPESVVAGWPSLHVVEPDVVQRLQPPAQLRDVREELERLLDRHLEHVRDRLALEAHLQRLAVVALAVAHLAR